MTRPRIASSRSVHTFTVLLMALGLFFVNIGTSAAQSTALGNLATSMQPGTWAELQTNNINTTFSSASAGGGSNGIITIYTDDAVWDPTSRQVLFIGGDHNWGVPSTAKFVTYSDATNTWQARPQPSWASGVMHGYDHSAIDPANGVFYHRPYNSQTVHRYSITSQNWDQPALPSFPFTGDYNNCCDAVEYFPELGGLVWVSGSGNVYLHNTSTNQWSRIATGLLLGGTWHSAEYNPVHHVLIFYSQQTGALYKLSSSGQVTRVGNPPISLYSGGTVGPLTVDPASGKYLALTPGTGQLYTYDVLTDVWQAQSSPTKPNFDAAVIATPISTYGVTLFVSCANSATCHMYLYKHSAGTPPPDTIPPSISISGPVSGATVSGTITVSANASDNVGVANVQFKLDGSNLGAQDTTAPFSITWDTTSASNGAHSLTALAMDAAGNPSTSAAVPVTVSNSGPPPPPPPDPGDFQSLCSQGGVLKCVGFDTAADLAGTYGDNSGVFVGDSTPQIDSTVKSSGNGSLKFTIPPNSNANSSGSYFTNFSSNLGTQFGENSEFYIQWRQRFSPEFITTAYSGGGGWKQSIIGTGDKPGCSASNTTGNCYSSCSALETVTQNTYHRGFAQMYNSCTGSTSHGPYNAFEQPFGGSDFKMQNAQPSPYCLYSQGPNYFPPNGNCFGYFPNEWMTFQVHITTGPRVNDEFTNSYVRLSIARQGQPGQLVLDWGPYNLTAGDVASNQKYGKIWLLPYNTGKNSSVTYPTAYTWYDDLIISSQPIYMGGTSDTSPPAVSVTSPANGATVSATITVSASASDNVGVAGVQFKLDGGNLGTEDTTAPYSASWNTTADSNGAHVLTAIARDAAGNQTTSSAVNVTVSNSVPDTTPPAVSITNPANGSTVSASITVSATASDNVGVAGVQFKLDGTNLGAEDTTSPYSRSWDTTTASNGSHTLTAVARDAAGNQTTSSVVNVTVSNSVPDTTPPAVSVTGPANGSTVSASITVSATASDNVGVAGVQFKLDGANLGSEDTTSPYSRSWDTTTASNGSHTLTAVARDAAGNQTTSSVVNVTVSNSVPDTTPPAVSVTSPANGSTVSATITVSATASDNVGVAGVQFKLDGANLGAEDTTSPYSTSWTTTTSSNGSHTLTAIARDAAGNQTTSSAVVVTVPDTTPPAVSVTSPANGSTVSATITVSATASDNVGVAGVQFKLDGANLGAEDTTSPYSTSWDTTTSSNGSHTLTAIARDAAGNQTTSSAVVVTVPDTTPPAVSVTSPANGSTVSATITVSATASDNVGVAAVQFKLDGANLGAEDTTSPYSTSWDTTGSSNGSHTLTAIARDAAGNQTTSSAVVVTVPDTTPPAVSVTSPANGSTVSATITVSATASDNVGVAGVQFKLDGANLGAEDTTSPYSTSWDTSTSSNGSHTLTAVARDAAGNQATSSAVVLTVSNIVPDTTPPSVSVTSPANGAIVSATISVSATASDNVGVVGVQFKLDGANLGAEDTTSPYSTSWNTTTALIGPHSLTAIARDAAGNQTTSSTVIVVVSNIGPPLAGLIGYWAFDAVSGILASDSSGANHNGTLSNSPTWLLGHTGNALQFSASDNGNDNDDARVVIGPTFDIATLPFTMSAWVNPTGFADYRAIFSKRDSYSGSNMRLDWGLSVNSGAVYLGRSGSLVTFAYAPVINTWTHVTVVATSTNTKLYVNGVLQQTLGSFSLGTDGTANTVLGGTAEGNGGDNDPFKGKIDEIRVYDRALTDTEVLSLSL